MSKIRTHLVPALAAILIPCTDVSFAQGVNLAPSYRPHQQTDSERLQNFQPPPPPPTTYPNISRESGEPRLNVNPNVSLGGNIGRDGAQGNVRFPIPGQ